MRLDHAVRQHLQRQGTGNTTLKAAAKLVRSGRVTVNGQPVLAPGWQFVPGCEDVALLLSASATCDAETTVGAEDAAAVTTLVDLEPQPPHDFLLLHKPKGVVCQRHPTESTVYDLVPEDLRRPDLSSVGRLDRDTTGALLLTTDGGVQSLLMFPTSRVWKTYDAELSPEAATNLRWPDCAEQLASGCQLEDGTLCAPAELVQLGPTTVQVRVHEGFFHQVKRMVKHVGGGDLVNLHRPKYGSLTIAGLAPGEVRRLTPEELHQVAAMLPVDRVAKRELPAELARKRASAEARGSSEDRPTTTQLPPIAEGAAAPDPEKSTAEATAHPKKRHRR